MKNWSYRLNGKHITYGEFLRIFNNAMVTYIERAVCEAIEDEQPIPIFHSNLGPLVIAVK